jgi:RNA polymerase sigma factor (sigma-70 family)
VSRDPLADPGPLLDRLYAYVAYRIGPGPEAEDVTGDVLERALRYRASYDPRRGTPIAWLVGIAQRVLVAPQRPAALPLRDAVAGDRFEEAVHGRVTMAAAVAALPPRDRELIALRYGADLPDGQIAEVLSMSPGAIRVAAHRALARLREELAEPGSPDGAVTKPPSRPIETSVHPASSEDPAAAPARGGSKRHESA